MASEALIGLGSNLGDRLGMLAAALVALEAEPGTRVLRVSHAYESEPWGVADQPRFANAVALVRFDGAADVLLGVLQAIEERLGRLPGERYGPRQIDLDLLLFGDEEWASPALTVPHPLMLERDFVVTPLLEVAPDATLPDGRRIDPSAAMIGRVVGVLGAVPGYEDRTPDGDEDADEAGGGEAAGAIGDWVPVGPKRIERSTGAGSDFDLLFYENVLGQAGIPCRFHPNRPNEGFAPFPWLSRTVSLMVPASRAAEAQALIERVASAPPEPPR